MSSQASLALSNLVSRGFTMAEARKKLGLDKAPEPVVAPAASGAKSTAPVRTNPAITPPPAKKTDGEGDANALL